SESTSRATCCFQSALPNASGRRRNRSMRCRFFAPIHCCWANIDYDRAIRRFVTTREVVDSRSARLDLRQVLGPARSAPELMRIPPLGKAYGEAVLGSNPA